MAGKKSFKGSGGGSVVERFLSAPKAAPQNEPEQPQGTAEQDAPKAKDAPARNSGTRALSVRYVEKATRRVQLVFPPSLYEAAKEKADAAGVSFNSYIMQLVAKAARKQGARGV